MEAQRPAGSCLAHQERGARRMQYRPRLKSAMKVNNPSMAHYLVRLLSTSVFLLFMAAIGSLPCVGPFEPTARFQMRVEPDEMSRMSMYNSHSLICKLSLPLPFTVLPETYCDPFSKIQRTFEQRCGLTFWLRDEMGGYGI
eukprot:scaffold25563_cov127-Cylindrotheca_fusiformis.AAC.2